MELRTSPVDLEDNQKLESHVSSHTTRLLKRQWLSNKTFEIILGRPPDFDFKPGQRIRLGTGKHIREYSIVSAPKETDLTLCIRDVAGGKMSGLLSAAEIGAFFTIDGPYGYFTYKPSIRPTVFAATGTGIAPFCSMARSGVSDFTILHGVRLPEDLYYAAQFKMSAAKYVPCLTEAKKLPPDAFKGKVTTYLDEHLPCSTYDFYLCGRREMIRDVTLLIDERFPDSLVYTEMFF
jgi:ferredoxin-NADP reductase